MKIWDHHNKDCHKDSGKCRWEAGLNDILTPEQKKNYDAQKPAWDEARKARRAEQKEPIKNNEDLNKLLCRTIRHLKQGVDGRLELFPDLAAVYNKQASDFDAYRREKVKAEDCPANPWGMGR